MTELRWWLNKPGTRKGHHCVHVGQKTSEGWANRNGRKKPQYCAISVQTRWPNLLSSEGMKQEWLSDCPRLRASRGICSPQDFNPPLAQRPEGTFWCRLFCDKAKYQREGSTRQGFCSFITERAWWAFKTMIHWGGLHKPRLEACLTSPVTWTSAEKP